MPPRLLSFLLLLLTLWSAFATQELTFTLACDPFDGPKVSSTASLQAQLQDGSVDDHHLDDLPAQAHVDNGPVDHQILILAPHPVPASVLTMAGPRDRSVPQRASPYIAGLKRPPRAPFVA